MSYRAFKRLLGETSLERKCRWLLGAGVLILMTGSFWVYARQTEGLAYEQLDTTGRHGCATIGSRRTTSRWGATMIRNERCSAPAADAPRLHRLAAALAALLLAFTASVAHASAQPLLEPGRVALVDGAGSAASDPDSMRRAILDAAAVRNWKVLASESGKVTLHAVTSTHAATVDVVYDADGFEIRYRDSVDMDYEVDGGHPMIHPRYNRWITTLGNEIRDSARHVPPKRH